MSEPEVMHTTVEFLLAEFNALQERATQLEQLKSNSTNFFLIVVAAVIAGVSTLGSSSTVPYFNTIVLPSAVIFVSILGFLTLSNAIDFTLASVAHLRRCGRIRRWFVERDRSAELYVAFEPNDDSPSMYIPLLAFRGSDSVVFTINVISTAMFIAAILYNFSFAASIIGFFSGVLVIWYVQRLFVVKRLQRAEKQSQQNIRFPHEKPVPVAEVNVNKK